MKRMSEVFELPVQAVDIEWLTMQSSDDTDEAIASAINHIDALADALEVLIKLLDDKEDGDIFRGVAYKESVHALAAYRGGK